MTFLEGGLDLFVSDKFHKLIVINHCKRVGKTDYLKRALRIARDKGLLDKKNRLTKDGNIMALVSNFNEHVSAQPWKDYWSR